MIDAEGRTGHAKTVLDGLWHQIADATQEGIWTVDPGGRTTFVNRRAAELVGVAAAELVGRPAAASALFGAPDPVASATTDLLAGALGHQELHARRPDGTDAWLDVATSPILGADGEFLGGLATILDVSARVRLEHEVAALGTWHRAIVDHALDVVAAITAEGIITYVTPSAEHLFGRSKSDLEGSRLAGLVFNEDQERVRRALDRAAARPAQGVAFDARFVRADGTFHWVEAVATSLLGEPEVRRVIVHGRDVTERRLASARLNHLSLHDPLTGLPNRSLLRDRISHALAGCARAGTHVAVCFVGIDRLNLVNIAFGHRAGDELLADVAVRLRRGVRGGDSVARFGGDEFTLVLEGAATPSEAHQSAQRVLDATFSAPFTVQGSEFHVSASMGVAVGHHRNTVDRLLAGADAAMQLAKRKGGARMEVHERGVRSAVTARIGLEAAMRRALDDDQFAVAYQPVVSVADRHVIGAEALVRWVHPVRGVILPSAFIALAEETGLVEPIGAIVFEKACAELRRIHDAHPGVPFSMSVNVSTAQLGCHRTPRFLHGAERLGVDPAGLVLEITEYSAVHDDEDMLASLQWLRAHGVRVAVDDFGTGYSSLSYVKTLPIDIVKIDRSFVSGLGIRARDTAIVQAIVSMAAALGLGVVAEGVETEQQLAVLADLGCPDAQGYLFGRPVLAGAGSPFPGPGGASVSGNIWRTGRASSA
jgi:diguanylate cyclase (GGDEF)-like protein/PAS domain S-box-containing protein